MKSTDLLTAMGNIEEKYIEEASMDKAFAEKGRADAMKNRKYKKGRALKVVAIAASLLLMLGTSLTVAGATNWFSFYKEDGDGPTSVIIKKDPDSTTSVILPKNLSSGVVKESAVLEETWHNPLDEIVVTSAFGIKNEFTGYISDHVNLKADEGANVYAVDNGTVETADYNHRIGYHVSIILENNVKIVYGHLKEVYVTAGQEVKGGDVIATVGTSGMATGPNLHFAAYVDGEAVNPLE